MTQEGSSTIWKHIGLHGHSVGSFTCDSTGIVWKSALYGHHDEGAGSQSSRKIPSEAILGIQWTLFGKSGHLRVKTDSSGKLHHEFRFDGFPADDFDSLKECFKENLDVELQKYNMSSAGTQYGFSRMSGRKLTFRHCMLEDADEEGEEFEPREGEELCSLDLAEVSQCVLPGNNRNEIELQFPESDAIEANNDQLVSVRFYIPPDPDTDPSDRTVKTAAELLQQRIMSTANIRRTTGDVIVEFDHDKGSFLTPRGRYSIELYDRFFRMRGQKYDYKIKYSDISRLFLLPKPDEVHMAFVVALDKPIRQGQQRYQHLVLQTTKDPDEVTVNLDEETLKKEYNNDLQPVMRGSLSNLVAKTFKVIAKKKVFIPGKFANANQQPCVKCSLRANDGLLYPLEKQFVFIHKPPVLIRFNEVESVEFQRYAGGAGSTKNFDLSVTLKANASAGQTQQEYVFSAIDRSDYAGLYSFLNGKKIRVKNFQEPVEVLTKPVYDENEIYGGPADPLEEESEDESYDADAAAVDDTGSISSDMDDDEMGSEIDDDLDSDLEAAKKQAPVTKKRKKEDVDKNDDDDDDSDGDDDAQSSARKSKPAPAAKPKKKKKDPNAPKNARSAWQLFASSVRSDVAKDNPDADFGAVSKLVSGKFKSLSTEERAKWDDKSSKDKERHTKEMGSYDAPEDDDDQASPSAKKAKKDAPTKPKKDPNAPKKNKTSYLFFMAEHRSKIQENNPDATFGDISKLAGKAFRELSPDEKKQYEDMAAGDKARYEREMSSYIPEPGSSNAVAAATAAAPKKKKTKDPDAPKRSLSSYMHYMNKNRSIIKEENPDASFGDIGKLAGSKFKALSAEEKVEYEELAAEDKARYQKEMEVYKKKPAKSAMKKEENVESDGVDEVQDDSDNDSDNDSDDSDSS